MAGGRAGEYQTATWRGGSGPVLDLQSVAGTGIIIAAHARSLRSLDLEVSVPEGTGSTRDEAGSLALPGDSRPAHMSVEPLEPGEGIALQEAMRGVMSAAGPGDSASPGDDWVDAVGPAASASAPAAPAAPLAVAVVTMADGHILAAAVFPRGRLLQLFVRAPISPELSRSGTSVGAAIIVLHPRDTAAELDPANCGSEYSAWLNALQRQAVLEAEAFLPGRSIRLRYHFGSEGSSGDASHDGAAGAGAGHALAIPMNLLPVGSRIGVLLSFQGGSSQARGMEVLQDQCIRLLDVATGRELSRPLRLDAALARGYPAQAFGVRQYPWTPIGGVPDSQGRYDDDPDSSVPVATGIVPGDTAEEHTMALFDAYAGRQLPGTVIEPTRPWVAREGPANALGPDNGVPPPLYGDPVCMPDSWRPPVRPEVVRSSQVIAPTLKRIGPSKVLLGWCIAGNDQINQGVAFPVHGLAVVEVQERAWGITRLVGLPAPNAEAIVNAVSDVGGDALGVQGLDPNPGAGAEVTPATASASLAGPVRSELIRSDGDPRPDELISDLNHPRWRRQAYPVAGWAVSESGDVVFASA